MIEYDNFKKSLKNLETRNEFLKTLTQHPNDQIKESVVESVIQRFEICYDCLWKILKHYLEEVEGRTDVPASPKGVFRIAAEAQILTSSIEQWQQYIKARNQTSHDYSGEKAQEAIGLIDDFIDDAVGLYQTMTGKTWE